MKKLFYLVVALCFIQVGISKAQTSVSTDKQKQETVTTEPTSDVKHVSGTCDSKKSATTKSSCSSSTQAPACCQKKGTTTGCSGASSTATTTSTVAPKNNLRKQDANKEVYSKQNLGTTPK